MQDGKIIYEDNHLLGIVKPAGMLTQADNTGDIDLVNSLKQDLIVRHNKAGNAFLGLVHRLDRPVGGAMVFAKTSKAASRLSQLIRERKFTKNYLAIAIGTFTEQNGTLTNYLIKSVEHNKVSVYDHPQDEAKIAILHYRVLAEIENMSLLEIQLETGRAHQIRAQLSHIGHPLVGDVKYGGSPNESIALWSYRLQFKHPTQDKEVVLVAEPPFTYPWNLFPLNKFI